MPADHINIEEPVNMFKCSDATNSVLEWNICINDYDETLEIVHGQLGGTMQYENVAVESNSVRGVEEQLRIKCNSRINKQWDKGYRFTIDDARNAKGKNEMGFLKPMLAHRMDRIKNVSYHNARVQYKLNGHRCLIHNTGSEIVAYSRNGKAINSISHITSNLRIPIGATIDGELYSHGVPIQTISSWVRRGQDDSKRLSFYCYDTIRPDSFIDRFNWVKGNVYFGENSLLHQTLNYKKDAIEQDFGRAVQEGYEGLIIRLDGYPYEHRRSKSLVKMKVEHDAEFEVVDVTPSRGKPVLMCITKDGKEFGTPVHGTFEAAQVVLDNKHKFIGQHVQIRYAELTDDGIPFHPVAIRWREEGE